MWEKWGSDLSGRFMEIFHKRFGYAYIWFLRIIFSRARQQQMSAEYDEFSVESLDTLEIEEWRIEKVFGTSNDELEVKLNY